MIFKFKVTYLYYILFVSRIYVHSTKIGQDDSIDYNDINTSQDSKIQETGIHLPKSDDSKNEASKNFADYSDDDKDYPEGHAMDECWLNVNVKKLFGLLDKLDVKYEKIRKQYSTPDNLGPLEGKTIAQIMMKYRGVAGTALQRARGRDDIIPAGLNLGGHIMMRMKNSVLFFHRLKLRNSTYFVINHLQTDLYNMTMTLRLSLNDLHIMGSYERCLTDGNASVLIYRPTFGQVEFLLKNVKYKVEARLRIIGDFLIVEHTLSDLTTDRIMMMYVNSTEGKPIDFQPKNIEVFLSKLKTNLNLWLMDYFTDYVSWKRPFNATTDAHFLKYHEIRGTILNGFSDKLVRKLINKVHKLNATAAKIPSFTINMVNTMKLELRNGVIRGFDNLHRRTAATSKKEGKIRTVNFQIGFSNLKVMYDYIYTPVNSTNTLKGQLILSVDDLIATASAAMVAEPETLDLQIQSIRQVNPEVLTVSGMANKILNSFRQLLLNNVLGLMSSTLSHYVKLLRSLSKCVSLITGNEPGVAQDDHDDDDDDYDIVLSDTEIGGNPDDEEECEDDPLDEELDEPDEDEDPKPDISKSENGKKKLRKREYAIIRKESAEIELPSGGSDAKKLHVSYQENVKLD